MRYHDEGAFYRVGYSRQEAESFRRRWPCSTVYGPGSFTFDASNGDLVDMETPRDGVDGADWLAFSQDCQAYGEAERAKVQP